MPQLLDVQLLGTASAPARAISSNAAREIAAWELEKAPAQHYWLHGTLLLAVLLTTLSAGAQLAENFSLRRPLFSFAHGLFPWRWLWQHPANLLLGAPFAFTLVAILLAHELGHYLACRYYHVEASLPYFIPAPTIIGTMGAVIRIRSPFPSRQALFDIGIAGPLAGFLLAVPALVIGLMLSRFSPTLAGADDFHLGYPLLFHLFAPLVPHATAGAGAFAITGVYLHPIAVAAWVGIFATALNLLPVSQLDGGHLLYALSPHNHQKFAAPVLLALLFFSPFLWLGWLLWACALFFFRRHPYVPAVGELGKSRNILAVCALLIFALCFTPAPFPGAAFTPHDVVTAAHWVTRHLAWM